MPKAAQDAPKRTLLLDDEEHHAALKRLLRQDSYQLHREQRQAWSCWRSMWVGLSDQRMPEMNGVSSDQVKQIIRTHPHRARAPICNP